MGLEFEKEKFGLEIEFSKARSDKIIKELNRIPKNKEEKYNKWGYTTETFSEKKKNIIYGGEVQSPVLTNNKKSLNDLQTVLKKLKKYGATIDGNQSMQVRVSMDIFEENTTYLKNFIKLYYAYEDIIYKFGFNGSTPRESIVSFAKPCDYLLQTIIKAKLDIISFYSSINLINNLIRNKQYGLSFCDKDNPSMPSSFEFRMFNGTLDYNTILNLINMSVCLTLNSKEELDTEKINYRIEEAKNKSIGYFDTVKEDKALEFAKTIFKEDSSVDNFMLQYKKR